MQQNAHNTLHQFNKDPLTGLLTLRKVYGLDPSPDQSLVCVSFLSVDTLSVKFTLTETVACSFIEMALNCCEKKAPQFGIITLHQAYL